MKEGPSARIVLVWGLYIHTVLSPASMIEMGRRESIEVYINHTQRMFRVHALPSGFSIRETKPGRSPRNS